MNELEKKLLSEEAGAVEPQLVVRSRTRIDTGRWWWPTPIWLSVVGGELLMLAVSRRKYVSRLPLDACAETYYCHTTGELVIEPTEGLLYKRFKVSPRHALELLKAMGLPQWEAVVADENLNSTE